MAALIGRSITVTGNPSISANPTGNPTLAYTSVEAQVQAGHPNNQEYMVNLGFTSAVGAGTGSNKVALYAGMVGNPGTASIWSINTVTTMSANSGPYSAQGYQLDFVNGNADFGNADGPFSGNVAVGLSIAGGGDHRSSTALWIPGQSATSIPWNRGITIFGYAVSQSAIQDFSIATRGLDLRGRYTYALDTAVPFYGGVTSPTPIRIGNNTSIVSANATSGQPDLTLLSLDTANNVRLGYSSNFVVSNTNLIPIADAAYVLGSPGFRWAAVYAANGTIQTADPSLKTDINPLPTVTDLVKSIRPVTYRWKAEPQLEDVEEEIKVQASEWHQIEEDQIIMQHGKAVKTKVKRQAQIFLWDEVPVEDEAGAPVMVNTTTPKRVTSGGAPTRMFHRVPRMTTTVVTTKKPVQRPGKRLHWGFIGPEVRAAFDKAGLDFGGHVLDSEGVHNLRPDELIPVLWKAVQDLLERVEALEGRSRAPLT